MSTLNQNLSKPISELLPRPELQNGDLYAVFRTAGNASYKLPYSTFVQQLVSDISARFHLSSMAFRNRTEFSPFDHQHGYSNVACYPVITPRNSDNPDRFMSLDIQDVHETKRVDLYTPALSISDPPEPDIGEVRCLATSSLIDEIGSYQIPYVYSNNGKTEIGLAIIDTTKSIANSISAGDFDGWVYPNGATYHRNMGCYDFSEAYAAFGGSGDTFTVPDIGGFFRLNPGERYAGNALDKQPGQVGIAQHSHELDIEGTKSLLKTTSLSAKVNIEVASNWNSKENYNTIHKGNDKYIAGDVSYISVDTSDFKLDLKMQDGESRKFGYKPTDLNKDTYPKHYLLPVQVYIGRKAVRGSIGDDIQYGIQVTDIAGKTAVYSSSSLTRNAIGATGSSNSTIRKIVVGADVTNIQPAVFRNFAELTAVDMKSCAAAADIPESCFENCVKLDNVSLPEGDSGNRTKIGKNAFKGCARLKSVYLPASTLSVDDCAFYGCVSLESAYLRSNAKFIGTSAFCGDSKLSYVDRFNSNTLRNSLFDIVANYAFYGTVLSSVNLSLRSSAIQTFWGEGCFQNCKRLESAHFLSANFMSRNMFKDDTSLTSVSYDQHYMAYTYPGIFDGCTGLKSIDIPAELLFVPENMFRGCRQLTSVTFTGLNPAIDEIQKNAFNGCNALATLILPSSINLSGELDQECFSGMPALTGIKFDGLSKRQLDTAAVSACGFFGLKPNHNVTVSCTDENYSYIYDPAQYNPPARTEYFSDKTAKSNFVPGKWYYNARDVYTEARNRGVPCLFIYSLWGCGPCSIYQHKLWNTEDFQDWFAKQKFLLCGLECEQQPMYDEHLRFLVDTVSVNAKNFAKEDQGETLGSKQENALDQKFWRRKAGNSTASNLMTPVLVFMDANGNCWDYTYHNISRDMYNLGRDLVFQQLQCLCLYHFDNNKIVGAKYVVDAPKAFNIDDYSNIEGNPWSISGKKLNLSRDVINAEHGWNWQGASRTTSADMLTYMNQVLVNNGYNDGLYFGSCVFDAIPWMGLTFPNLGSCVTSAEMNAVVNGWEFKIGTDETETYYNISFGPDSKVITPPCSDGEVTAYKLEFTT